MSTKKEIDFEYELNESINNMIITGFEEFQLLAIARFIEVISESHAIIPDSSKKWDLIHKIIKSAFHKNDLKVSL